MNNKDISINGETYRELASSRKRMKLSDFHGILSKESGAAIEKSIKESREMHKVLRKKRIEKIIKRLSVSSALKTKKKLATIVVRPKAERSVL